MPNVKSKFECLFIIIMLTTLSIRTFAEDGLVLLNDVRSTVEASFEKVNSLKIQTEVYFQAQIIGPDGGVSLVSEKELSRRSHTLILGAENRIYFRESLPFLLSEQPVGYSVSAFDGTSTKHFTYNPTDAEPKKGVIAASQQSVDDLSTHALLDSELGRAWGLNINGASLPKWLVSDKAQIVTTSSGAQADHDCITIDVPYGGRDLPGGDRMLRFFLSRDHSYALARFEAYVNGLKVQSAINSEFIEIAPRIWFAKKGRIEFETIEKDCCPRQPIEYDVVAVENVNQETDEMFSLDFEDGTLVRDKVSGLRFRQGEAPMDKSSSQNSFAEQRSELIAAPLVSESPNAASLTPNLSIKINKVPSTSKSLRPTFLGIIGMVGLSVFLIGVRKWRS